jgi:hypothetical protein
MRGRELTGEINSLKRSLPEFEHQDLLRADTIERQNLEIQRLQMQVSFQNSQLQAKTKAFQDMQTQFKSMLEGRESEAVPMAVSFSSQAPSQGFKGSESGHGERIGEYSSYDERPISSSYHSERGAGGGVGGTSSISHPYHTQQPHTKHANPSSYARNFHAQNNNDRNDTEIRTRQDYGQFLTQENKPQRQGSSNSLLHPPPSQPQTHQHKQRREEEKTILKNKYFLE